MARVPASLFAGRPVTAGERRVLALVIGVACALGVWIVTQRMPAFVAKDFTYPWRAARALLAGLDPYVVMQPTGAYPFESRFPYPIPAALVALPVAWLPAGVAAALFFGASAAALSWALLADGGIGRLAMLASAPFAMALVLGQWAPLLVAGALLPAFGWALACKPTLGLALFVSRPSRGAVVGGAALTLVGLLLLPRWPLDWVRAATQTVGHPAFVVRPFGWIPLLALVRWRDPDARLIAALACVPQNPFFYDQLPLWLVARSGRAGIALSALSWVAYAGTRAVCDDPHFCGDEGAPWVLWLVYVPATLLVLARGRDLPAWVRSQASRVRSLVPTTSPVEPLDAR